MNMTQNPTSDIPAKVALLQSSATFTASFATGEDTTVSTLYGKRLSHGWRSSTNVHSPGRGRLLHTGRRYHVQGQRGEARGQGRMFANMPGRHAALVQNEGSQTAKMLISVAPAGLEQMFFEVGVPLTEGAMTALPPSREEIEKLLKIAPNYASRSGCRDIDIPFTKFS